MTAALDPATRDALVREWTREGVPPGEQARRLGVSRETVRQTRRRLGILQARPWTDADTARALQLLDDGCSFTEVGRTLGRSPATICRRFPGRGWSATECGRFSRLTRQGVSA